VLLLLRSAISIVSARARNSTPPRTMASAVLTAFHPQGSALALSAGDGRIKVSFLASAAPLAAPSFFFVAYVAVVPAQIWDATTGNLRNEMADLASSPASAVAPGHLAMDYTCMAWGALPANASAKKVCFLVCSSLATILSNRFLYECTYAMPWFYSFSEEERCEREGRRSGCCGWDWQW
jgi:hypothetical protein